MPERTAEPVSPELILVSPPEEAALAREQLEDPPPSLRARRPAPEPSNVGWNDFLADVRSRPVDPVVTARPRIPVPVRRKGRKRLLVAIAAIVAVAAVVGLAWARDRAQQKPASSASSMPVPSHRQVTTPKSTPHATTTHAPAVTTAPKSKSPPPPKRSTRSTKRSTKPRAKHTAGFVPTRIWSWAAAPGAGAYVVRFLRDGHKVLKIRTGAPRLRLPSSFSFVPGRYRWTVTAIPRNGKGRVIVNSSFTVTAQNG